MRTGRLPFLGLPCLIAVLVLLPSRADAQWYLNGYMGASHTQNADVSIRIPSQNIALDFHDVRFVGENFIPRRYYGVRLGRLGGERKLFGFELELIHMKAVGDTSRHYDVTAAGGTTLPASGAQPMDLVVSEYRMTHGLNLVLVNAVWRRPFGSDSSPVALMLRAGGGPTFPHAETTVVTGVVHHYEYAGLAGQGAAGIEVRFPFRLSGLAEYKLTYTRPEIDLAQGTSTTTALAHHISAGIGIALTPR